jgi:hypothetical protein
MLRRVVSKNSRFEVMREANSSTTRDLLGGDVLNLLQPVRPGFARFTIEGEGADIWFCLQPVLETHTELGCGVDDSEVTVDRARFHP